MFDGTTVPIDVKSRGLSGCAHDFSCETKSILPRGGKKVADRPDEGGVTGSTKNATQHSAVQ